MSCSSFEENVQIIRFISFRIYFVRCGLYFIQKDIVFGRGSKQSILLPHFVEQGLGSYVFFFILFDAASASMKSTISWRGVCFVA